MKIITVGKSQQCDIILKGDTFSRVHAQLAVYENHIEIIDLESTKGTFVNGHKIKAPTKLNEGDGVVLGGALFDWESLNLLGKENKTQPSATNDNVSKSKNWIYLTVGALVIVGLLSVYFLYFRDYNNVDGNAEQNLDINNDGIVDEQEAKNEKKVLEPGSVEYDFSCLNEEDDYGTTDIISTMGDIEDGIIDILGEEITIEDEHEFGRILKHEMITADYGNDFTRIQKILQRLIIAIPGKTEYNYEIHLVEEDLINAFTCGGQIFVYQGMIDFCNSDDELAAILAHEIAHNELGHIKHKLSQIKTANELFGEGVGQMSAEIYMSATAVFGQKDETHCDLYGIDLAFKAKYNSCKVIDLWKRMDDNEYSVGESMIRTHPFSSQRSSCCQNHINKYHPNTCP
jgi:pSer/pThr/pTyr-binding forkhead associated (FHA) protein